jgi:hypothetical protein
MSFQLIHRTSLCVALVTAPLLFAFEPAVTWWFPSCPLRALTGWLCPFCGSLRALHALLHGAPEAALALNPLTTVGVLGGLAAILDDTVRTARGARFEGLVGRCFSARGLALTIAFGVFRNVPVGWLSSWMAQ